VAPTTDWIRLQRRFPVTIYLDEPPPDGELFMGAACDSMPLIPACSHPATKEGEPEPSPRTAHGS
jgi:hypothetical protein